MNPSPPRSDEVKSSYRLRSAHDWLQLTSLMMAGEEVVLTSDLLMARDTLEALGDDEVMKPGQGQVSQMWGAETQNLLALSILLGLALVTNLSAAPVILFRRTR